MSITINHHHDVPEEKTLEQLANALFTTLPGTSVPLPPEELKNLTYPQESSSFLPATTSDSDKIYSQVLNGNTIPQSTAGSGLSPSALEQNKEFNISDPQTSLPDPHFAGKGIVPKSAAGSGVSPASVKNKPESNYSYTGYTDTVRSTQNISPFQETFLNEQLIHSFPYHQDPFLQEVIKTIPTSVPSGQLPAFHGQNVVDPSFYFLTGKNHSLHEKKIAAQGGIVQAPFDVNLVRKDFPILQERVNGKPLIWLDNAATTQKPSQVMDRIRHFYEHENSNIHRAAHELAARATDAYEEARQKVQHFINAGSINEIVFVRGTTEAINLVAKSWGEANIHAGDEIIVSHLEHHANIVPWQQLATLKGARLRVIPVDEDGQIILEEYAKLLNSRTKLVSFTQVSNALGTITPAKAIVDLAHAAGAHVLVDGAQSVSHIRTDVQALQADWFVFSGHKVFGPTGIGVLYGKEALLNQTPPWQGGGNMIQDVTFEKTIYHPAPARFEAGTGNIADAVGLGAAIDYVTRIGIDLIAQYEHALLVYATTFLQEIPGLRLIGTAREKASVLSFVLEGYKTEEVGTALNEEGIAVRSGHHCAQPILRRFGLESTVRPSLAFYNTCAEIDVLVATLHKLSSHRKYKK